MRKTKKTEGEKCAYKLFPDDPQTADWQRERLASLREGYRRGWQARGRRDARVARKFVKDCHRIGYTPGFNEVLSAIQDRGGM